MRLELTDNVAQIAKDNAAMMGLSTNAYIESLILADDEFDPELARLAERIKGCETAELALKNGVEVPTGLDENELMTWLTDRSKRHLMSKAATA